MKTEKKKIQSIQKHSKKKSTAPGSGAGKQKGQNKSDRVHARYEKGEATLNRMRQAIMEELVERGYHQTSICDIVKRADLTRGAFYNYWDSLDTCVTDVLDYLRDDEADKIRIMELMNSVEHPSISVRFIKAIMTITIKKKWTEGYVSLTLLQEKELGSKKLRNKIETNLVRILDDWQKAVAEDVSNGVFRKETDVEAVASGIMNMSGGILHQDLLGYKSMRKKNERALILFVECFLSDQVKKKYPLESIFV